MTSASLSAKNRGLSLYLHTIKSGIGLMVAFFLLLFLSGPMPFIIQSLSMLAQRRRDGLVGYANIGEYGSRNFALYLAVALIGALVIGLITSSFMHNRQAVDVYGALPVKRGTLLLSKALGGLTMILIPYLLTTAMFYIAQGFLQAYENTWMLWTVNLASYFVYAAAIFIITIFCAVNTGTVFDTAIFSLTMCGAPTIVLLINRMFFSMTLIGYNSSSQLNNFILGLSPIAMPFKRLMEGGTLKDTNYTIGSLVLWPIAAVLLLAGAVLLFKRRDNELAGASRPSGVMQLAIKLMVADIAGVLISMLFIQTLSNNWLMASLGFLLGAFVVYFVTDAILARGFKTFGKMLFQFAFVTGAVLICTTILYTGGLGYSSRIPDVKNVRSVTVSYGGVGDNNNNKYIPYYTNYNMDEGYTDPAIIEQVIQAHREITQGEGFRYINATDYQSAGLAQYMLLSTNTQITYTLQNGRTVTRFFTHTPVEARESLYELDSIEAFRVQNDISTYLRPEDIVSVSRTDMTFAGEADMIGKLTTAQANALCEALKADAAAATAQQILSPTERELFTLLVNLEYTYEYNDPRYNENYSNIQEDTITRRVYAWDTNTLSLLRELGWKIDTTSDTNALGGAYLLGYGDTSWVNPASYTVDELGGVFNVREYDPGIQELYYRVHPVEKDMEIAQPTKDYPYGTETMELSGEMLDFMNANRITDPARIAALERACTGRYNAQAGEKFYTVAFENAFISNEQENGGIAQTVSVYMIPEDRAPEFLKAMKPLR